MYNLWVKNLFEVLQFDLIKDQLRTSMSSQMGKERVDNLSFLPEKVLAQELELMNDFNGVVEEHGLLNLGNSSKLEKLVDRANKGGSLNEEEIIRVYDDIITFVGLKNYCLALPECFIKNEVDKIKDVSYLTEKISRVIDVDLSIKDNASPTLKSIRNNIKKCERDIKKVCLGLVSKYEKYLSSQTLNLRNGHFVLPVQNSFKNVVKGLVFDVSSSGNTTFIEPEEITVLNNKIAELRALEREEIIRLLAELSSFIGKESEDIIALNNLIGKLDFLQGKFIYGRKINGHLAYLNKEGKLFIPDAVHPLLNSNKVVPNSFTMDEDKKIIILSGPNAGGKSVAIKTLGLCAVMFKMGLMVPCKSGAEIPYFKHIYIDLGDSQSIQDNLSTFSGHMANIGSFINSIGGKDLILLDELGSGTSPREGEALALAIVEHIREKHSFAIVSSHFDELKQYALAKKGVVNASMLFDEETFTPSFLLKIGLPGNSFALKVATNYGIDEKIISSAKDYLDSKQDFSITESLNKINKISKEYEIQKVEIDKKLKEIKRKENDLNQKEKFLKKKMESYEEDMKNEKNELIEETKEQINQIMEIMNKKDVKVHEIISMKNKLDDLLEEKQRKTFDEKISIGDYVEVYDIGISGKVLDISGNKVRVSSTEGYALTVDKNRLVKIEEPVSNESSHDLKLNIDSLGKDSLSLECNIIGMRFNEAKNVLEDYLDKCRVKGFKRVRIIHGFGSGVLRNLTQNYCKSATFVEKFENAGEYEGGSGATIVYLK